MSSPRTVQTESEALLARARRVVPGGVYGHQSPRMGPVPRAARLVWLQTEVRFAHLRAAQGRPLQEDRWRRPPEAKPDRGNQLATGTPSTGTVSTTTATGGTVNGPGSAGIGVPAGSALSSRSSTAGSIGPMYLRTP